MALEEHFDGFSPTKIGAPLKPMGKFPLAKASDILVSYDESTQEEKRLDQVIGLSIDKITYFNFASGDNNDVYVDENGISWNNDETEIEIDGGALYLTNSQSSNRVPLVAGDGVEFELDTQKNVVKIKSHGVVGSGGIIDVDNELPTENINENAIYRVSLYTNPGVLILENGQTSSFEDEMKKLYENLTTITKVVTTIPNTIEESTIGNNGTLYVYIEKTTGIAYINWGNGAQTVGYYMFSVKNMDKGWITNVTGDGVYCKIEKTTYTYNVYKTNDYTKEGLWVEIPTIALEGGKKTFESVLAVTTPEQMDSILSDAELSGDSLLDREGNYYIYVGPATSKYRRGVIYKLKQEVKE
jgi:hypothetical protein